MQQIGGETMYFINEWHKTNYNHMVNMVFRNSKNDPEYHVIAYILSLPEIIVVVLMIQCSLNFLFYGLLSIRILHIKEKEEDGEEYIVVDFDVKKDDSGKE